MRRHQSFVGFPGAVASKQAAPSLMHLASLPTPRSRPGRCGIITESSCLFSLTSSSRGDLIGLGERVPPPFFVGNSDTGKLAGLEDAWTRGSSAARSLAYLDELSNISAMSVVNSKSRTLARLLMRLNSNGYILVSHYPIHSHCITYFLSSSFCSLSTLASSRFSSSLWRK